MLAAEHCPDLFANVAPSKDELLEIHHSKISLHRAKTGYNYPTIRLPHTFSRLAGLPTRIYQTVHKGALAFLVVISPNEKAIEFMVSSKVTENFSACSITRNTVQAHLGQTHAFGVWDTSRAFYIVIERFVPLFRVMVITEINNPLTLALCQSFDV
jgi:hypothetical protein